MTATLPEPLLSREGTARQLRRRLLLVSYHFPPGRSVGALRWEKLAGLAAERGWGLDVVTLDPGSVPAPDWTRLAGLPAGIRVYGVPSCLHPAERLVRLLWRACRGLERLMPRHASLPQNRVPSAVDDLTRAGLVPRRHVRWRVTAPRDYVRGFEAWLDFAHESAWSRAAGLTALRLAQPGVHQVVVTSGPPHMVHQAGRLVSRRTGSPHVMDMRDPWSLRATAAVSQASPAWFWLARRYERTAVARAALVVTNTEPLRIAMQALYPNARSRVITVLNGCDEESMPSSPAGRRFTIAYAGSIYLDRNPSMVFRAAARVVRELQLTPEQFGFEFVGGVDGFGGVPLEVMARDEGLAGYVRTQAALPRREALALLAQAAMLLSLPQSAPLSIPSKIFEYMQFHAWLLVLAQRDSATELLLRGTAADVVEPHDLAGIGDVLRTRYLQFAAGARATPVGADGRFSRRAQAGILFAALEDCVARGCREGESLTTMPRV